MKADLLVPFWSSINLSRKKDEKGSVDRQWIYRRGERDPERQIISENRFQMISQLQSVNWKPQSVGEFLDYYEARVYVSWRSSSTMS